MNPTLPTETIPHAFLAYRTGMGNVQVLEVKNVTLTSRKYAQYASALVVTFTPKGKRNPRQLTLTYEPMLVLLAPGSDVSSLQQSFLGEAVREGDVTVRRSTYSMCSPEWTRDWRQQLQAAGDRVRVIFDAEGWNAYQPQLNDADRAEAEEAGRCA